MQVNKVQVLVVLSVIFITSQEKCKDDGICVQMKTHGLWSADCYRREFRKFPQCLRSDVEIIDLSYNRLRQITKEDLSRYSNLKILYLSDNTLTNLKNTTFEGLDNLISLDLSLNGISKLPSQIFQLPSLKRLYLSQNQNINVVEVVKETVPITSPLESIDISFNDIETLPHFGIMPYLSLYNISGNNLLNMEIKHVAGLCNLRTLSNINFTSAFNKPCECWNIQRWLKEKAVYFIKIKCEVKEEDCPYSISDEDNELHNQCKQRIQQIEWDSKLLKIVLITVSVISVILILVACVCYRRRKSAKKQKHRNNFRQYEAKIEKDHNDLL